jgi:hypothetical protein
MQDLSNLLKPDPVTALAPTSQAGGNQIVSNANAQTAPGSQPAQPATSITGEVIDHNEPVIPASGPKIPPGTDGKPQPGKTWSPGAPAWKK